MLIIICIIMLYTIFVIIICIVICIILCNIFVLSIRILYLYNYVNGYIMYMFFISLVQMYNVYVYVRLLPR